MKKVFSVLGIILLLASCSGSNDIPSTTSSSLEETTFVSTSTVEVIDKNVKVVVLAGQSNAAGYTHSEYLKDTVGEDHI